MRSFGMTSLPLLCLLMLACGADSTGGAYDGIDDTFMTDGKADGSGVVEGSAEARAVLHVVNTFEAADLVGQVGLSTEVAGHIVLFRTERVVASLVMLDTIPNVGRTVFESLLRFVRDSGLINEFVPDCAGNGCLDPEQSFILSVPSHLSLPFVTVGNIHPSAPLTISNTGGKAGTQDLVVTIADDFTVEGDWSPLAAHETRVLTVSYQGSTTSPRIAEGLLHLTAEGRLFAVPVVAVIGDAALPATEWESRDGGLVTTMPMPSAPFPHSSAAWTDRSVMVAIPSGLDGAAPFDLVTHLHGHRCVIGTTIPSVFLVEQFFLSGRNAILVIPQGPVNASSGNFGKLMEAGGFARLVRDVVSVLYRDKLVTRPVVQRTALTAHSGGYLATAAILRHADLPISTVHLFDALYGDLPTYNSFATTGGLLRSNYTSGGGTASNNTTLLTQLANGGVAVGTTENDEALRTDPTTIVATPFTHFESLWAGRVFARWLRQSDLPPHRLDPPELRSVISDGTAASVAWMLERADSGTKVVVEGSSDGATWAELGRGTTPPVQVAASAFVRVRRVNAAGDWSDPSDTYPGSGADWLIVDGFDRVFGGGYQASVHGFAATLCQALGAACSGASNEAVALGQVDLANYPRVLWMLGDESRLDVTFDAAERAAIDAYLAGGGHILVSGAEVGYATDAAWLQNTLHATYAADSANTATVADYTFGVAYEVKYPDVLSGSTVIWNYATGGAAAVGWNNRVVVVGFPIETITPADLPSAMTTLRDYFGD